MSVDVFGRTLEKKEGIRGPPGAGYKFTNDGEFDAESRRLCNLAVPIELDDAVNLRTLKALAVSDIKILFEATTQLKSKVKQLTSILNTYKTDLINEFQKKLDELEGIVEAHRDNIDQQILQINFNIHQLERMGKNG